MDSTLTSPASAAPAATPAHTGPGSEVLTLTRGTTHRREARAGARLQVEAGRAWITVSGDPEDHFLAAGDSLHLPAAGRLVVEGDSATPARIRLWGKTSLRRP